MGDYLRPQPSESSVKNMEIAELENPIIEILRQIREKIEQGSYNLVIGDDASGRIPALIFNRILENIYQRHGIDKPKLIFLAGSTDLFDQDILVEKVSKIKDYLLQVFERLKLTQQLQDGGRQVLIATETISHGSSLNALAKALTELGVRYDIASVGFNQTNPDERQIVERKLGARIYFGQTHNPAVMYKPSFSGVTKERTALLSVPAKQKDGSKKLDISSRSDVEIVAGRIINNYESAIAVN